MTDTQERLVSLAEQLKSQLATKKDLIADTRRVTFAEPERPDDLLDMGREGTVLLVDQPEGVQSYRITKHAHSQIATHLGVPQKLYDRLLGTHPDLLDGLANGLLSREPSKRMLRTLDGQVRAFLSDAYRPRDNWDLLDKAVLPVLAAYSGNIEFKQATLTETRMYLKIVLPDFAMPVTPKVGDVIRGGIIIQNSEVGNGALGVFPYTDRLICLNGMVHTAMGQRERHVSGRHKVGEGAEAWDVYSASTLALDDAAFFAKVADTVRATLNETIFQKIVGQMQDLAGLRLSGAPDKVVEVFADKNSLTDGEAGSMLAALIEGADLSAWGFVNAITQTARDLADADRQTELESLAGRLVANPSSDWVLATA